MNYADKFLKLLAAVNSATSRGVSKIAWALVNFFLLSFICIVFFIFYLYIDSRTSEKNKPLSDINATYLDH